MFVRFNGCFAACYRKADVNVPTCFSWSDIHIGQVIERYQSKRVADVKRRTVQGCVSFSGYLARL